MNSLIENAHWLNSKIDRGNIFDYGYILVAIARHIHKLSFDHKGGSVGADTSLYTEIAGFFAGQFKIQEKCGPHEQPASKIKTTTISADALYLWGSVGMFF